MEERVSPGTALALAGQEVMGLVAVMLPGCMVMEAPEGRDRFAFELTAWHFPTSHH